MANEKRLIDANALMDDVEMDGSLYACLGAVDDVRFLVDSQPTVDAVEVVRCCDCVSCKVILDNDCAGHCHCKKRYGLPEVDPTDFCSLGERKDNGDLH